MAAKPKTTQVVNTSRNGEVMAWKTKTEQAKKGEILREINKLEIQIQAMEREKGTHIYSKRSDYRADFVQLEEQDSKMTTQRKTEKIKLRQQLEKISHMVKRFQRELKDIKPTPEFVEKLKVIMEDIEGTINTFKLQQRQLYEELMKEERTTTQEIQALEKRFEVWSQVRDGGASATRVASVRAPSTARDITKDLPPEVAAFEKFLQQTGGVRGGWDEYDHQTFLKFRNRFKGKNVFVQHLIPALPTKQEDEIHDHESWYQEYLFLNDVKKDAIKAWRQRKQGEKEELLAHVDEENLEEEQEEMRKAQLKEEVESEKRERFSRLNAWRVQKELEKAQVEERRMREEMARTKKQEDEKKRQMEMRSRVLEYKQQRKDEEEFLRAQEERWEQVESERKQQLSAREIVKFRDRDLKAVSERVMKKKAKEEEEIEKEKKLARIKQQVEMFVPRDPTRLYKPTKGWKERLKEPGPSGGGQVLQMPHRAVPSWRQGLN
ncbi:coiled-coil domain-containing protein 112-like [Haliotis rufescens]|uniref:coiled-coil domain-containing protein 112-like n=1 Tax=Haliotis rufescens TaxID=6454 RepID=UPI00201EACE5|nr:coiled-coil domain-containing protein 112-like [Haliotis rufescens]